MMILFQGRICVFKYRQYMYIVHSSQHFFDKFSSILPPRLESSMRIRIMEVSYNADPNPNPGGLPYCRSGSGMAPILQIHADLDPGCLPYCGSVRIRIKEVSQTADPDPGSLPYWGSRSRMSPILRIRADQDPNAQCTSLV